MLKLTNLEFSETLELGNRASIKGGIAVDQDVDIIADIDLDKEIDINPDIEIDITTGCVGLWLDSKWGGIPTLDATATW